MADTTLSNDPLKRQEAQRQLNRANLLEGVGAGVKALGSLASGVSSYTTALARASVYSANAAAYEATIPFVREQASQRVGILQQETSQFIGAQRASLAANGVMVDQDTGLEAAVQAAGVGARQVVEALQAARNEVAGIQNKANQARFEAALAERKGKGDLISGVMGAGQSILGAASTISKNNQQFRLSTGGNT